MSMPNSRSGKTVTLGAPFPPMKLGPLRVGNFGLQEVEDFVPYSGDRALITAGPSLDKLKFLVDVTYTEKLKIEPVTVLATGSYIRLGHMHEGKPVYSDGRGPHQPFRYGNDIYWADGAPNARVYRNGILLINHLPGLSQIGKPWVHDDVIYFEGHPADKPVPWYWSVYRADLDGSNVERLCEGANPVIYDGVLYTSLWDGDRFGIVKWPLV